MKKVNKIPVFEWFYEQGDIYITIFINSSGLLSIPPEHHNKKLETFIVGNVSTPNLSYDETGIRAPMRFRGNFFDCFFPWENITVMSSPKAVIHFAIEVEDNVSPPKPKKKIFSGKKKKKSNRSRSHLRVVK